MKVVHLLGSLDRGGAESVALDLCRAIPNDQADQQFLCLSGRSGSLSPAFVQAGATVTPFPLRPFGSFPVRLFRELRRSRPEAVVSHVSLSSGVMLCIAAAARVRVRIARLHSDGDGKRGSVRRTVYRKASRLLMAATATHLLAVSGPALDFGTRGSARLLRLRRVVASVVPNGVDTRRFRVDDRRVYLDGDVLRVLYVGRAAPEKNRALLPLIAESLGPGSVLTIVGPGGHDDLSGSTSNIVLENERGDVENLMRDNHVLVLTSIREGLPGVVLEALASGLPVVASDIPPLRALAGQVLGIALVPLTAPMDAWVEALRVMGRTSVEERQTFPVMLARAGFSLEASSATWLEVWAGSRP